MARTLIAVQGLRFGDDGLPASGEICAKATAAIVNDGVDYPITPVCGLFDGEGRVISQAWTALELYATDDADTTPVATAYQFTLQIDGQDIVEFAAALPAASTATDEHPSYAPDVTVITLGDLIAAASMVGQSITGEDMADGTTVTDFDPIANTLTISNPTTGGSDNDEVVTVGGAVLLTTLEADAL